MSLTECRKITDLRLEEWLIYLDPVGFSSATGIWISTLLAKFVLVKHLLSYSEQYAQRPVTSSAENRSCSVPALLFRPAHYGRRWLRRPQGRRPHCWGERAASAGSVTSSLDSLGPTPSQRSFPPWENSDSVWSSASRKKCVRRDGCTLPKHGILLSYCFHPEVWVPGSFLVRSLTPPWRLYPCSSAHWASLVFAVGLHGSSEMILKADHIPFLKPCFPAVLNLFLVWSVSSLEFNF